ALGFALRLAGDGWLVPGAAVGEASGLDVEHARERGDEKRLAVVTADFGIGLRKDVRRVPDAAQRNALEQRFRKRHEEAGREALAGNVADEEEEMPLVGHEAVVEVATDGARRLEKGSESEALLIREELARGRQQAHLDPARGFELARDTRLRLAQGPPLPIGFGERRGEEGGIEEAGADDGRCEADEDAEAEGAEASRDHRH